MRFPQPKPYALFIDLDNTIARIPTWAFLLSLHTSKRAHALQLSCETLRGFRTPQLDSVLESRIRLRSASSDLSLAAIDQEIADLYKNTKPFPIIYKLREHCTHHNWPMILISDHPSWGKLTSLGLQDGWTAILSCRHHGALKPLPDTLWAAAAQSGVPPQRTIYIGDRPETDGRASFEFGCQFIHIDDLQTPEGWDRWISLTSHTKDR